MTAAAKKTVAKAKLAQKNILSIEDLSADDITTILDLAETYVIQNRRKSQTNALLKGLVLVNVFLENSTRTRLSFDMAAKRLGADVITLTAENSSMQKGESYIDTLKAINAMRPDIVVTRHIEEGSAVTAASILECPVINAGDGMGQHPTQALLDALTLRRQFGRLEGLRITILGDVVHSRVARSNASLLEKMGAKLTFVGPQELLPTDITNATSDIEAGLKDADAIMVLRIQKERLQSKLSFTEGDYYKQYGLSPERLALAHRNAVVLHPGPMNRGVEIDPVIADDPARSMVTLQVEMGVAVRMALLDLLTRQARSA